MEKIGIITDNKDFFGKLKKVGKRRNIELFRFPIEDLKKSANQRFIPELIVVDLIEDQPEHEDLLENFSIENPEILMIIISDKVSSSFLLSYAYLVIPKNASIPFIMDILANSLSYQALLIKSKNIKDMGNFKKAKESRADKKSNFCQYCSRLSNRTI